MASGITGRVAHGSVCEDKFLYRREDSTGFHREEGGERRGAKGGVLGGSGTTCPLDGPKEKILSLSSVSVGVLYSWEISTTCLVYCAD